MYSCDNRGGIIRSGWRDASRYGDDATDCHRNQFPLFVDTIPSIVNVCLYVCVE